MIGSNYESTLRAFVGPNADYYLEGFQKIENGQKAKITWCGFIGGAAMLYRKMVKKFFITFLLSLIPVVGVFITISRAFRMTPIYYEYIKSKLEENGLTGVDYDTASPDIQKKILTLGGTSVGLAIGVPVGVSVAYALIMMILLMSAGVANSSPTAEDPHITTVKALVDYRYPDGTLGEAFDAFFSEEKWEYGTGSKGEKIVEFSGRCTENDKQVLIQQQFIFNDKGVPEPKALKVDNDLKDSAYRDELFTAIFGAASTGESIIPTKDPQIATDWVYVTLDELTQAFPNAKREDDKDGNLYFIDGDFKFCIKDTDGNGKIEDVDRVSYIVVTGSAKITPYLINGLTQQKTLDILIANEEKYGITVNIPEDSDNGQSDLMFLGKARQYRIHWNNPNQPSNFAFVNIT